MLTIILARAEDGAIGHRGDLLWHISADLRRFKRLTTGHPVIMGRRTWESLPGGALPGRLNIVVSGTPGFKAEGALTAPTLDKAVELCGGADAFIIGGASIYAQALPLCSRIELTRVYGSWPEADTRMPDPCGGAEWRLTEQGDMETDSRSGLRYKFETWSREGSDNQ